MPPPKLLQDLESYAFKFSHGNNFTSLLPSFCISHGSLALTKVSTSNNFSVGLYWLIDLEVSQFIMQRKGNGVVTSKEQEPVTVGVYIFVGQRTVGRTRTKL